MKFYLSIAAILILHITSSYAQVRSVFVFRVLANKGTNQVLRGDDGEKIKLRPGLTLMSEDQLIVSSGSYIGLMHNTGRTIEVRTTGTTSINDLETKLANSKRSIADKYATFVMNKMNDHGDDVHANYRHNMKATGAVERANSTAISAMMPSSGKILNGETTIRWNSVGENSLYVVTLKNIFDEEIYVGETDKTNMSIDLDDENLSEERLITLSIKVKDDADLFSPEYGIERLSSNELVEIQTSLKNLKSEVSTESPLELLILASFYEENNLILDALKTYEDILEMAPEVEDFKVLYGDFLIKNGLSEAGESE